MGRKALIGAAVVGAALILAGPSRAGCQPGNPPQGVRLPHRPGCGKALRPPAPDSAAKQQREPGFFDLRNGTEVRISGRVRVEGRVGR